MIEISDENLAVRDVKAAKICCVAVQTLRNWRCQRKGPPYIKIGRSVRYRVNDLLDYLENHRVDPEAAA
jgi:hypothetical protein